MRGARRGRPALRPRADRLGRAFDRDADGKPALAIEGAHSARRVLHAHDATGREIGRVLWRRASALPGVRHARITRARSSLIVDGETAAASARGSCTRTASTSVVRAQVGAARDRRRRSGLQRHDESARRDRRRRGAGVPRRRAVADLEFVQFHPTALKVAGQPRFLLSEALRGEGARLLNAAGERFMARYDPAGDLAPRDRVARASCASRGAPATPVYLSLAASRSRLRARAVSADLGGLPSRRASTSRAIASRSGPAAHYVMGGVQTDLDGRTTIAGLFAAGEVACTGVHGANRLASNSLLEGLVFGARAGRAMRADLKYGVAVEAVANPLPARGGAVGLEFVDDAARRLQRGDVARRRAVPRTGPASRPSSASSNRCGERSTPGWPTTVRLMPRAGASRAS